jgi:multiple sugar transport system ATP-binding protein
VTAQPLLKLAGVTKRFGVVEALGGVDLEVGADELLVVLGPTGAGKTTLLRVIAGLELPERGQVLIGGADLTGLPPAARDVAMVFQNFSLYPDRTVRENMAFPLRAPGRNMTAAAIRERVEWAARLLKITGLLERKSWQLSGGEMQRVAIGRAIVRRPRLFLMDEPLSNLDAKLREALRVELVCLRRELKTPMIFVTHDQVEAMSMGDRLVVLSAGRVLQTGRPQEVYRRPVSPTVARQLGQPPINILEVRKSGGLWITATGAAVMAADRDAPVQVRLGIRPEDIAVSGGAEPGVVRVVEDTGPSQILVIDWGGCSLHALAPKSVRAQPGERVFPRFDARRAVVWPA